MHRMKYLLSFLFLLIGFFAGAAHWMTYYVYHETHYEQGPWVRQNLLQESGFKYLLAESHKDLFGTEDEQMIKKMMSRLQDKKPEIYHWNYELEIKKDSVIIIPDGNIEASETIKNEITATMAMNGFEPVIFKSADQQELWTMQDLSLPLLDLITVPKKEDPNRVPETSEKELEQRSDSVQSSESVQEENASNTSKRDENSFPFLLLISGILNVVLLIILFRRNS